MFFQNKKLQKIQDIQRNDEERIEKLEYQMKGVIECLKNDRHDLNLVINEIKTKLKKKDK